MVRSSRTVTAVSLSACVVWLLAVCVAPAVAANKPLPQASTFVVHGTVSASGQCEFTKPPSVTHEPGEGTIEVRPVETNVQSCTQTWERGLPSATELAAEGVPGGSSQDSSVESGSPRAVRASVARRGHARAHAAATFHHDYVFAREHGSFGEVLNAINVTVEYYSNGSSITSCVSERAKWEWDPEELWSLGTHNEHEGCAGSQIYSSAYGFFSKTGCSVEYNRTAIFAYPSGKAEGFGPVFKCYNPPPYAWFITEA